MFPIDISSKNPQKIIFKWISLRTFFALIFVAGSSITTLAVLKHQMSLGPLTASNIRGVLFFTSCAIICILFFRFSLNFKTIATFWMKTESLFSVINYQFPRASWLLQKKILFCTVFYLTLSTIEHFLFLASEIYKLNHELQFCNKTDVDTVEIFINRHLSFVVKVLPFRYNNFVGLFLEYLNFSYTFFWNFLDLFIILISIGIAFLFEKINCRLSELKGLFVNEDVWAEIRCHHAQVCQLLELINASIGEMLMLACCIDGYFILLQLLNITT